MGAPSSSGKVHKKWQDFSIQAKKKRKTKMSWREWVNAPTLHLPSPQHVPKTSPQPSSLLLPSPYPPLQLRPPQLHPLQPLLSLLLQHSCIHFTNHIFNSHCNYFYHYVKPHLPKLSPSHSGPSASAFYQCSQAQPAERAAAYCEEGIRKRCRVPRGAVGAEEANAPAGGMLACDGGEGEAHLIKHFYVSIGQNPSSSPSNQYIFLL